MCKEKAYKNQWIDASMSNLTEPGDRSVDADNVARLDPAAQALIGQQLKTLYGRIVEESVPQHLLDLLEELERQEKAGEKPK